VTVVPHGVVHDSAVDVVQVFTVSAHPPHVGDVAPAGQLEVRVCVHVPVWPAGQLSVCVCGESDVQDIADVIHELPLCTCPLGQLHEGYEAMLRPFEHTCATGVVHVVAVFVHPLHVGDVAPAAQLDVRVCVMEPVCPAGHESVCVCAASGVHVAVAGGVQV